MKLKLLFLTMMCLLPMVASAEVSFDANVTAFAEADNAALAKEKAMVQANRDAFLKVAARLTTKTNVDELNKLTDEQIAHFIREATVSSEKNGAKTYEAVLSVKINGNLLKQYMQENNMLEMVSAPSQVLIIPLFADTLYPDKVLWEDGNVWMSAWLDKGLIKSGPFDFKVIPDIAPNKKILSAFGASNMSADLYDKLVKINGIKDIFVVNAVRAGRNNLVLIITSVPDNIEKRFMVTDENGQTLEKAIAETVGYITITLQDKHMSENTKQGFISAVFRYQKLKEWLNMEKRLKSVPQIKNVKTESVGNGQVKLNFEFSGSEAALRSSMENLGIFVQSDNGSYILR